MALLEIKSRFRAEFRRISVDPQIIKHYNDLHELLERLHELYSIPFVVQYVDPKSSDLLPINNDKNFELALSKDTLLRILIECKGESYGELHGYAASSHKHNKSAGNALRSFVTRDASKDPKSTISVVDDFQLVSTIMDVDIVPRTMRRVRLNRIPGKEFGLVIRSQETRQYSADSLTYDSQQRFYVSRLTPGGIAAGSGLLAVDDEIIEVNGIEVDGKTLDQVTDMMVANLSNLVITIQPKVQEFSLPDGGRNSSATTFPNRSTARSSNTSAASQANNSNSSGVGGVSPKYDCIDILATDSPYSPRRPLGQSSTRHSRDQPPPPANNRSTTTNNGPSKLSVPLDRLAIARGSTTEYDTAVEGDDDDDDVNSGRITL